jgi:hypothetical protein
LPGRAGKDALGTRIHVDEVNAIAGNQKLPNLIGMSHAARFEDIHRPGALAAKLDVTQQQPRVHQRRDVYIGLLQRITTGR